MQPDPTSPLDPASKICGCFVESTWQERYDADTADLIDERDAATARAERAEADVVALDIQRANLADAVGRVTALADEWCAMDPYGEISFNDAADALLAALDAQRPAYGGPEGEGAR